MYFDAHRGMYHRMTRTQNVWIAIVCFNEDNDETKKSAQQKLTRDLAIRWSGNITLLIVRSFDAHECDRDISVLLEEPLGSTERTLSHILVKNKELSTVHDIETRY